jgi:alpha-glucosidase (family GH31 glycosyl hydrolase)
MTAADDAAGGLPMKTHTCDRGSALRRHAWGRALTLLLAACALMCSGARAQQNTHLRVPITPPWALECWVWEDDHNTKDYVLELLKGYEDHDIPARTILIDSPWSTRYNDFTVDEQRYPDPGKFFGDLQQRGYRVVLWMTPMVNSKSSDTSIKDDAEWFNDASTKGYLAGGPGSRRKWWKGVGGFIDYTNPDGMKWWRGLQQQLFDWGIDGWKLDGTDPYFGSQQTHSGTMDMRGFADHYYRDEYLWGLKQNPEFITLARAIDGGLVHRNGFAPLDAAPVAWVGDQNHAWTVGDEGIQEALTFILKSANLGYCVLGSDVGGYHGKEPIPANVYIRWAQFSTFCGLFLNGGHGERMLWKRSPEEFEIIRKFAWLHDELVPYIYSHVVNCHNGGKPIMRPLDADFEYLFGEDFLVAPYFEDAPARTVTLPEGKWRYFFDDREVLDGPTSFTREFPLGEAPVFIREGAVVPMKVTRPYTGLGDKDSAGAMTWLINPGAPANFTLHQTDGSGDTSVRVDPGDTLRVALSGVAQPHILRILCEKKPAGVRLDGKPLAEGSAWRFDEVSSRLVITARAARVGTYEITTSAK